MVGLMLELKWRLVNTHLDSNEFRSVIDELEEYYLMLKKNEEIENESI